ncbi:MAG: LysR family transcriptional regulator [Atopobiaceae bacterium]|jgi:DNA-binding transcriptional LysR family regulator|nr:LysR family transcriptional regulator [Atopobiaceae bacterium]
MELRVLRYYLAVCREGTMSAAAESLHVTQPTLSRQIADLERELGCELLERHSRSVTPTEQGIYLRRRAEELVGLADQTAADLAHGEDVVEGDVWIGAGESETMRSVAARIREFRELHPQVRFHIHSGDSADVVERLEHGSVDFAVLMSYPGIDRYDHVPLSPTDAWGVLMPEGDPLAEKDVISPIDLVGLPLIASEQAESAGTCAAWLGEHATSVDIVATYNLLFNAEMLVRERVGYALCLDRIATTGKGTGLEFRLLYPPAVTTIDFAWKRGQVFSAAPRAFLESLTHDATGQQG